MTSFSIMNPDMSDIKWIQLANRIAEKGMRIKKDKRTSKYGIYATTNELNVHWVDTIDEALISIADLEGANV